MTESNLNKLREMVVEFRDIRDWKQFHNPKDMAISLALEAAEVMEHFQWKNTDEFKNHLEKNREDFEDEIADVLYWVLLMANDLEIDLGEAFMRKLKKNGEKYPVEKAKGRRDKYTAYQ
jgi:NTP pyrophosphatase (non-canonical NTP hydrolase)